MDRELRRRLQAVDPALKIISRPHPRKESKKVNIQEWEAAAGPPCPKCGQTDVRFLNGVCRECYRSGKEKKVKQEARLTPLIHGKDRRLASRIQRYLAKRDRKA